MIRIAGILIVLLALAVPAMAAEPPFTLPGMKHDVEFAKVGDVSLTLDAYVPEGDGPFPTCILVHGGGFTQGDKQSFIKPLFEPLAKAGFTWFTINYRLAPQHPWPACGDDVAAAVRWVRQHAAEYKVDVNRIALIGESAGGHLVSWVGTTGQGDTAVAAVVPFYGPNDLMAHVKRRGELRTLAGLIAHQTLDDVAWRKLGEISPITQVRAGLPPFLLIHGDQDSTVTLDQSQSFQKKMQSMGNTCDLLVVAGGEHGMGGWAKLGSDYQQQMIAWLRKILRVP